MLIKIKDNLSNKRGVLNNVDRSHVNMIKSRVLTHEGEVLTGRKGERYRSRHISDQGYTNPVKRQGNWADLPHGALPSDK